MLRNDIRRGRKDFIEYYYERLIYVMELNKQSSVDVKVEYCLSLNKLEMHQKAFEKANEFINKIPVKKDTTLEEKQA